MSEAKINEALSFLTDDIKEAKKQWENGDPFQSVLQRNDKDINELLEKFDPSDDENEWCQEYGNKSRAWLLKKYRKRMAFLKASRKEFHEEYDGDVTDVDFMRLMEVPFTDSEYIIECGKIEMGDAK